jgi:hypothetical protein
VGPHGQVPAGGVPVTRCLFDWSVVCLVVPDWGLVVLPDTRAGGTNRAAEGGSCRGYQREGECAAGRCLRESSAALHQSELIWMG